MSIFLRLADRCEAATGPDRELEGLIWRATASLPDGYRWITVNGQWCQAGPTHSDLDVSDLFFTASLDAAMTLMPENAEDVGISALHNWPKGPFEAEVVDWDGNTHRAEAATPALALTAAALRARAAL